MIIEAIGFNDLQWVLPVALDFNRIPHSRKPEFMGGCRFDSPNHFGELLQPFQDYVHGRESGRSFKLSSWNILQSLAKETSKFNNKKANMMVMIAKLMWLCSI